RDRRPARHPAGRLRHLPPDPGVRPRRAAPDLARLRRPAVHRCGRDPDPALGPDPGDHRPVHRDHLDRPGRGGADRRHRGRVPRGPRLVDRLRRGQHHRRHRGHRHPAVLAQLPGHPVRDLVHRDGHLRDHRGVHVPARAPHGGPAGRVIAGGPAGRARRRPGARPAYARLVTRTTRLTVVLLLTLALVAGLVAAGIAAHAVGVLAAGGDYLADAAAIGISLLAIGLARRAPTRRRPGGFHRATAYAALVNVTVLLAVVAVVAVG